MTINRFAFVAYAALLAAPAALAMDALDADGDGVITYEEMLAAVPTVTEEAFIAIDTNGDGTLDAEEYAAAEEAGTLPVPSEG